MNYNFRNIIRVSLNYCSTSCNFRINLPIKFDNIIYSPPHTNLPSFIKCVLDADTSAALDNYISSLEQFMTGHKRCRVIINYIHNRFYETSVMFFLIKPIQTLTNGPSV